jgi:hypothetical protein
LSVRKIFKLKNREIIISNSKGGEEIMVKKKAAIKKNNVCCHGNGWYIVFGILMILLGIGVWNEQWITLSQLFAIVFVLIGLKKLFWKTCCY